MASRAQRLTAEKIVRQLKRISSDPKDLERLVDLLIERLEAGDDSGLRRVAAHLQAQPAMVQASEKAEAVRRILELLHVEPES